MSAADRMDERLWLCRRGSGDKGGEFQVVVIRQACDVSLDVSVVIAQTLASAPFEVLVRREGHMCRSSLSRDQPAEVMRMTAWPAAPTTIGADMACDGQLTHSQAATKSQDAAACGVRIQRGRHLRPRLEWMRLEARTT